MDVVAYDIFHVEGIEEQLGMRYVELDELFAVSDFISLHTPAINGQKLINAETIAKMKDGAVFVNTSRGNNVDEDALLAALESGKLYAAGLDVYAEEPSANHALYSHPRVSCTPHIGAATREAQKRIGTEIVSIIKKPRPDRLRRLFLRRFARQNERVRQKSCIFNPFSSEDDWTLARTPKLKKCQKPAVQFEMRRILCCIYHIFAFSFLYFWKPFFETL